MRAVYNYYTLIILNYLKVRCLNFLCRFDGGVNNLKSNRMYNSVYGNEVLVKKKNP